MNESQPLKTNWAMTPCNRVDVRPNYSSSWFSRDLPAPDATLVQFQIHRMSDAEMQESQGAQGG